ncbi:serine O-acetyltransferase [Myceligenerans crystallogenes]|uniref:Serine acetyltransferase n=2 Tax=Myceligenerans crystallogenes TaxID=316335 RepID=A0ABP4ZGL9_9MICO
MVLERDPAARSKAEILCTYPGMHAVWAYRVAHIWWGRPPARLAARILSQLARRATGVDIHPAARIGRRLFIDHGTGVVIGATAEVGEDVTIYHGVTLGGRAMSAGKRHPTLGDRVMVGAGAKVLGPVRVGADAKIGANAVVVTDVPDGAVAVGVPARLTGRAPADDRDPVDQHLIDYMI